MKITDIKQQKKDQDRVSLYIDGAFALGISVKVVIDHNLKVGQEIDQTTLDKIQQTEQHHKAYLQALHHLSTRPRSIHETRQHLQQRLICRHPDWPNLSSDQKTQFSQNQQDLIDGVIEKLIQSGYLDDLAFALWWIDNRRRFRPRGSRLLQAELAAKGVSPDLTKIALETVQDHDSVPYDESTDAVKILQKYLNRYSHLPPNEQKQRAYRYLASKGYDYQIIETARTQYESDSSP